MLKSLKKGFLMIEQLLLNTENPEKIPKSALKNENFILFLLKDSKNPKELLKSLHINKEDLNRILKNSPKNIQKELKELIDKITSINEKEINTKTTENQEKSVTILSLLNQIKPLTNETENKNEKITIPKKMEIKITEIIKKEIDSKIKTQKILLTAQETLKFKEIKTLKELIAFANKKGLNIKKIIYSKKIKPKIEEVLNETKLKSLKTQTPPQPKIIISSPIPKTNDKSGFQAQNKITLEKLLNSKSKKTDKPRDLHFIRQKIKKTKTDFLKETFKEKQESERPQSIHTHSQQHSQALTSIIHQEIKQNILKAKQSLKHFASNLQEAIKDYKPPIHKLSIELNPKELGKVEVTLTQRGENLQIQINSTQSSTINFFNTHQNELKNILVNMGYSEVNMSFNSNQQQQQRQQYKQNQQNFNGEHYEDEGFVIEIPYKYA